MRSPTLIGTAPAGPANISLPTAAAAPTPPYATAQTASPASAVIAAQERGLSFRRWDGSSWQAELVEEETVGDLGHDVSLLLDGANQPTIVYSRNDGANRRLRLAWHDGSSWQFSTNAVSPPLGSTYELAGARSAAGMVYVAYYEMGGGDLRLATWGWGELER